jgi:predicted AlkP superfamily pyrophosphatase or phosphodiesterase
MRKTVVINVVGLTRSLMARGMPALSRWAATGHVAPIAPAFPAVTCTAQADYLTGQYPDRHGIVGNGWYSREDCEVRFWKQASPLVDAPRIWEIAKAEDPSFTAAGSSFGRLRITGAGSASGSISTGSSSALGSSAGSSALSSSCAWAFLRSAASFARR